MRYRLRTLLILLAVMPPVLWFGWSKYQAWQERKHAAQELARLLRERRAQGAMLRIASGPDEVLKSLGPPPPGLRWIKTETGVGAVPIDSLPP